MIKNFILFFSLAIALTQPLTSPAQTQSFLEVLGLSPYTDYKTFETQNFKFIYQDTYLDFTKKAATHFEHAHQLLSPVLKWQPRQKTTILIADNADSANGLALPALRVGIVLIATPPDAWSSLAYNDDWIKLLVFHEYTHFLNIDPTTKWAEVLRYVFGDIVRLNGLWPTWMLEGLAVYFETRTSKMGRGRSPYFDSILRALLQDGRLGNSKDMGLTLDRINGDFPYFPGGEIPYLFGYHLWNQFSKDTVSKNMDERMGEYSLRSSHRFPYLIEGNLGNITGKHWINYWDAFLKETQTRLGGQIEKVKALGVSETQTITQAGYAVVGGTASPDGQWIAYTQTTQERRAGLYLKNLSSGKEIWVDDKISGARMSFTADSRHLIYSALENFDSYRLFSDLFIYHFDSLTGEGSIQQLTNGLRAKDPSLSADGTQVTFLQVNHANSIIKTAPIDFQDQKAEMGNARTVYTPSPFSMVGSPQFLDKNTIVFSLQEIGKSYSDLMKINLSENAADKASVLFHDGSLNRMPSMNQDHLVFVSDKTGIENIYSLDARSAKPITNVTTGVSLPFGSGENLFFSLMTSQGYEIVKLKSSLNKTEIKNTSRIAEPSAPMPMTDSLISPDLNLNPSPEDYSPWDSMLPRAWAPIAFFSNESYSGDVLGGFALGFDSTGKHQYFALADYNFKPKTADGYFSYTYYGFRPAITFAASATTTDIAADASRALYRRKYSTLLNFEYPIMWTYSALRPGVYGFVDWRGIYDLRLHQRQSTGDFEYKNPNVPGFGGYLAFSDAQTSRIGFMPERGTSVLLAAEERINVGQFSLWKYLASVTQYFKIGSHNVFKPQAKWLGSSRTTGYDRGYAMIEGRRRSDLTDDGSHLNLQSAGIRGYSNVTLYTRALGIGSLDFHFPVHQFFSGIANTAPVFFKQMHGFVFGETGFIPTSRNGNIFLPAYGAGLNLDTTLLIRVPVRFTLQVQNGTKKNYGGDATVFFGIQSSIADQF